MSPQPRPAASTAASNGLGPSSSVSNSKKIADPAALPAGLENLLQRTDSFVHRHLGPGPEDQQAMLRVVGVESLDALIDQTIPASIRLSGPLAPTGAAPGVGRAG